MQPSDATAVLRYRSDPDVARFQTWEPQGVSDMLAFIRIQRTLPPDTAGSWYQLTILRRSEGIVIGDCGLHFPDHETDQAEVGITLDRAHHGNGYATEALSVAIDYLFNDLGKHRVYARVDPRNHASVALMERLGLRCEGRLRETVWLHGEWADDLVYAVLANEWHRPGGSQNPV